MADLEASLIYLGRNGTIKIDKKGRPKLFKWASIEDDSSSVCSSNSTGSVGATTIRLEEDTSVYDTLYHLAANRRSNHDGHQYMLKPSTNGKAPAMAVQRGTSVPVHVDGVPRPQNKHGNMFAVPVQHTSTINIQMILDQQIQQLENQRQRLLGSQQRSQASVPVPPPPPPPVSSIPTHNAMHHEDIYSNGTRVTSSGAQNGSQNGGDMMAELRAKMETRENLSNEAFQTDEIDSDLSYEMMPDPVESDDGLTRRVSVAASGETVVLLQFACEAESTAESSVFYDKLTEVAQACLTYFKKLSSDKMELSTAALSNVKLNDQRSVSEHLQDLQTSLSDTITATATGRKASEHKFVGTFINDPIPEARRGQVAVGKMAVIVVLKRLNRLAPLREFSDQLCHHVALFRPEKLGKPGAKPPHMRGWKNQPRGLLEQGFLYDNTITVGEASRRAFTEITDFTFLG